LASTHLLWEEKQAKKQVRKTKLMKDLVDESSGWITKEQINERITPELFACESASTGYMTRETNHWKYQVFTPKLGRLLDPQFQSKFTSNTMLMDKLQTKSQYRVAKRVVTENLLDQLVGSGKERENYKNLVNELSSKAEALGGFDGLESVYDGDH
jgi:hypothetical protein